MLIFLNDLEDVDTFVDVWHRRDAIQGSTLPGTRGCGVGDKILCNNEEYIHVEVVQKK